MIERLYDTFKPNNYKLKLDIDSEKLLFSGSVVITGLPAKKTNTLKLHVKELKISSCSLNGKDSAYEIDEKNNLLIIKSDVLVKDSIEISVQFNGKITDTMHGMYPCYFEHDGKRKKLIATQFESHHAREVFPCVDEPAAKATFDVELTTNEGETVLSNMPVSNQQINNSRQVTVFETTPVMSTYLLAFVTGEMVSKESKTKDGVIVRSWASAAQDATWLDYSVKETVSLIEFYNEYFDVPYPLEKCDQVALPDFESGAMENWGLVTYRETVLLSDSNNPSLSTQQWITLVVAHELSHQWFGNLVTMQWWDDLWLNESFANMTEYLAADKLHPEWNIWEEFTAQDAVSATNRDVYSDVQAVRVEVNNPSEIHTLFDPAIVYAKGGKLLKMLHNLLGEDAWRAGLKKYFTTHAYRNTVRDDLWNALGSQTEIDVAALMNNWIEKAGQPLVTVTQEGNSVKLKQERLMLDAKPDGTQWQVPLLGNNLPDIFEGDSTNLKLESDEFIKLNNSGIGHYISNYANPDHKKWLAKQLIKPDTETTWKIARLNELVMLAKHGTTSLVEALDTIKGCQKEQRAMVWSLIGGVIGNAHILVSEDENSRNLLKKLSADLAEKNFKRLGWNYPNNEDSNDTHLRTISLGMMIASEREDIIEHALKTYRSIDSPEQLPAESRNKIMSVVAKFGSDDEFENLISLYKKSQNADFKTDICSALTDVKTDDRINSLLDMMLDTKTVRPQDLIRWYIFLLRNRHARQQTWQWLKDNWAWIMKNFGGSKSYDDFARYSANIIATQQMMDEYINFFSPMKDDPALKRAIAIGTEEIKARVEWKNRDEKLIAKWLKEYSQQS